MEKEREIIAELKKLARKSRDARQRRQYDIVRLYLEGRKKPEIAEIMDMSLLLPRAKIGKRRVEEEVGNGRGMML